MKLLVASLLLLGAETGQRTIENWMVYDGADMDREWIVFIERSALYQRPDGWVNFAYFEVMNGSRLKSVKSRNMAAWANCKTREFVNDYRYAYGTDGTLLLQEKIDEPRRVVTAGSIEEKILAFACGDQRGAVQMPRGKNLIVAADELYARHHPQVATAPAPKAPATAPAPPARAPTPAPGRAADYWLIYPTLDNAFAGNDIVTEIVVLVDRSTIQSRPGGWITFDYVDVRNGSEAKNFKWRRMTSQVNCKKRQFADTRIQVHKSDGTPPAAFKATMPPQAVETDSLYDVLLTYVCGNTAGATQLRDVDPVTYADTLYVDSNLFADSLPATASAPLPRPTAAAAATPQRAGGTPSARRAKPELWFVSATADDSALFFVDKASILRKPDNKAEYWQEVFVVAQDEPTVQKQRMEIDCARRTLRGLEAYKYDIAGKLSGAIIPQPESAIAERSVAGKFFAFVCQGKEDFADKLGRDVSLFTYFSMYKELSDARKAAPNRQGN